MIPIFGYQNGYHSVARAELLNLLAGGQPAPVVETRQELPVIGQLFAEADRLRKSGRGAADCLRAAAFDLVAVWLRGQK